MKLVLTHAEVFDGEGSALLSDRHVVIDGERILRVGAGAPPAIADADVIDLQGRTLLPGLIDAHFHCNSPSFDIPAVDRMPVSELAQHARHHLESTLLLGFTTVRDAGGADIGLKRAVESGLIRGPRLLIAGKALSQTGGHGDMRAAEQVDLCGHGYQGAISELVDGVDSIRKAVRNQLRQGADQIKLFVSGGVLSPTDPIWMDQFSDEEIRTAVEEAATRRTYVMAHAHTARAAKRCVANGVRSIEHGTLIDAETADYIANQQAFVVPTLSIIEGLLSGEIQLPQGSLEKLKSLAEEAYKSVEYCQSAGVRLGLGTDFFGELRGSELQELVVRARLSSNAEALRSATSINAEIIGKKGELGVIKAGAIADLIVIDGNPLEDISKLASNLKLILRRGEMIVNRL